MVLAAVQVDDEPRIFARDVEIGMELADKPEVDPVGTDIVAAVGIEVFFRDSRFARGCSQVITSAGVFFFMRYFFSTTRMFPS